MRADRELPVVWAVAKGSVRNKLILVPAALAISAFLPWAVTPLLMVGGLFLCYEGFEKVAHKLLHRREEDKAHHAAHLAALTRSREELLAVEKDRIKGAIRTDFILSAEIIVIALGTVPDRGIGVQSGVLTGIAALMTVGVYGLVAGIVKLDDAGLNLCRKKSIAAASSPASAPALGSRGAPDRRGDDRDQRGPGLHAVPRARLLPHRGDRVRHGGDRILWLLLDRLLLAPLERATIERWGMVRRA